MSLNTKTASYIFDNIPLRAGADGLILKAICTNTKERHAIKVYELDTKQKEQRFKNETTFATMLSPYKGTITVKETFKQNKLGYMVMNLAHQDLLDVIEVETSLLEDDALFIFYDICQAVFTLHKLGVAHLDIKPENILITENGEIQLCDFASASYSEKTSIDDNFVATPAYTAPERFTQGDFDAEAADVWSLGVLLHVMVTGYFPFFPQGPSVQYPRNTDFSFVTSHVSTACSSLIKSLLASDPSKRPSLDQLLTHPIFEFIE